MYICMAGGLKDRERLSRLGAKAILVSFIDLKKSTPAKRMDLMREVRSLFEFVIVDSGAHSYFNAYGLSGHTAQHKSNAELPPPQVWWEDYLAFALENHAYADAFAEFDVGVDVTSSLYKKGDPIIVEMDQVYKWRQEAVDKGVPREKYLPVFHPVIARTPGDAKALFAKWCEEFPFLATGGEGLTGQGGLPALRPIMEVARAKKAKLHGFAVTSSSMLVQAPLWYSVDSTSWMAGAMFGVTYDYQASGKLVQRSDKGEQRKRLRERLLRKFQKQGLDASEEVLQGYVGDEDKHVNMVNAWVWTKFAEIITERQVQRKMNYWDIETERDPTLNGEVPECTCGSEETAGACSRHGKGFGGNGAEMIPIQETMPEEQRRAIAVKARGNLNALVNGRSSARVPQIACDECYVAGRCPGYQEGALCCYDNQFAAISDELCTRNRESILGFLAKKVQTDWQRYMRAVFFETIDGGMPNPLATQLSARLSSDTNLLARMTGQLHDGNVVDNRQITMVVQQLGDQDYTEALQAMARIRRVVPELLNEPDAND